ncbi:Hemolymph protein 14 [Operophtera brumata]|uniref:Hemolymph protein 14 n=1 Tax=Operophtera brumata TaxID=104452 RepID=A0A0L7L6N8_OPEBR|nr:Hemolymph protein 14 [Operophtera brumata]
MEGAIPNEITLRGAGQCRLDPRPSVEYWCMDPDGGSRLCRDLEPAGTRVYPKCRPNYYSQSDLAFMRCLGGRWDYIATCLPGLLRQSDSARDEDGGRGRAREEGGTPVARRDLHQDNTTQYNLVRVPAAAHCFWSDLEKQLPASQFAVAVGKLYRPWGDPMDHESQQSDVTAIHLPVRYKGATTNYQDDIAVLVVSREFQYGNLLMVVEMPYVELGICFSESPFSFQQYITSDKICAGTLEIFSASTMGVERYYLRGVVSSAPAPTSENLCNTASGEFHCVDGSFITSGKQCDGAIDCADGSDETNDACATNSCSEFRCAYGACVDRGAVCNGVCQRHTIATAPETARVARTRRMTRAPLIAALSSGARTAHASTKAPFAMGYVSNTLLRRRQRLR